MHALASHESNGALRARERLIPRRDTGTNVNDVVIGLVVNRAARRVFPTRSHALVLAFRAHDALSIHRRHHPGLGERRRARQRSRVRRARSRSGGARRADHLSQGALQRAVLLQVAEVRALRLAEPIPGPTTDRMQALAKELEIVLIVPIFEKQARGVYRNSAAIIDADGSLLGVYRKMHIPDDPLFNEKYYFTPGDAATDDRIDAIGNVAKQASGFRVWKTRYANIGVLICWDQWYPEAARITALLGADILFYPTAIGWHPAEKAEFGAGAGRRVAHDAALARDRERRVRRVAESRRPRRRAGHERHRVLRPLVHRRSVRPHPRRGGHGARRFSSRRATRS